MKKRVLLILLCSLLLTGCGTTPEQAEPEPNFIEIPEITEPDTAQTLPLMTEEPPTEETTPPAPEMVYINYQKTVELNSDITIAEFITASNVTIEEKVLDSRVDTSQPGEYTISLQYLYGNEKRSEQLTYQVKDTTPPVILNDGNDAFIKTGETFDLRELIGYGDNYDTSPTLTYDGDVNTEVPGNYMVIAYLTDCFGNQSSCRLNVIVADEKPPSESSKNPIDFEEFVSQYAVNGAEPGIDISKWQGYVDFDAVKKAGCQFVIMRIGSSSGYPVLDEYYQRNIKEAKSAGLKVGVYFYTTDTTETQIHADAEWIAEQLGDTKLDFPIAFDWEDFRNFQKYGINLYDLNMLYQSFAYELHQHGHESMLYSSKYFLLNVWEKPDRYPIWLAHYTPKTDYTGNYYLWQRSDSGRIDGIDGNVDFNILYPQVAENP